MGEDIETIELLRNSAAAFAKFDGKRVRSWRGRAPGFDRAVWHQMGELGWLSTMVSEDDGALGLGVEAAAVLAEHLGRACSPEPFLMGSVMWPAILAQASNQVLKDRLLAFVLPGDMMIALTWQPVSGALLPEATEIVAERRDGTIKLFGECRFVMPAHADGYMVLAREQGKFLLVWVEPGQIGDGLEERGPDGMPSARLRLSGLSVPDSVVLLAGNQLAEAVQTAIDQTVIVQSAELCGLMQRCLEMTPDYLKTRQQFGAPIGSFQALQHRCVDLFIQQELARHATAAAIRVAVSGGSGTALALAASSAKSRAAHAGMLIGTQAIQLHGAIGFTDEYDLGLYMNRIVRLAASHGNAAWHRRRFADLSEGARP